MSYDVRALDHASLLPYIALRAQVFGWSAEESTRRLERMTRQLDEGDALSQRVSLITLPEDTCALVAAMAYPFEGPPWQAIVDWSTRPEHLPHVLPALDAILSSWQHALAALDTPPEKLALRLRIDRIPDALAGLEACFHRAGWERRGERVEFKTPVSELPTEWEGPLTWRDLDEVGLEVAAATFAEAGKGPDWEDEDDPYALISEYLSNDELFSKPSCVEVGFDDRERPVAFLVAQTAPDDGWCTITFMGVVEGARGSGLGKWVHRRGFELMRRQGGALYHGGTNANNLAMRSLFARHACVPYVHLSEWRRIF